MGAVEVCSHELAVLDWTMSVAEFCVFGGTMPQRIEARRGTDHEYARLRRPDTDAPHPRQGGAGDNLGAPVATRAAHIVPWARSLEDSTMQPDPGSQISNAGELRIRRFRLVRDEDLSGISGTGAVAEGVLFSSGKAVLSWCSNYGTIAIYEALDHIEAIHGHEGRTRIEWIDQ